jgi:uncharacterized Zn-finger protein
MNNCSEFEQSSTVKVEQNVKQVACNGVFDGKEVPHPKVYLKLIEGFAKCPYCETSFVN